MSHKKKPLALIESLANGYNSIRVSVRQNEHICQIPIDSDYELMVHDTDPESDFKFYITNPEMKGNLPMCGIAFSPENTLNPYYTTLTVKVEDLMHYFNSWLSLVKAYDVRVNTDEDILSGYEEQYAQWFDVQDADRDTRPFGLEEQILLTDFLNATIAAVERDPEINQELIENAEFIRDNVTSSVKSRVAKQIGKLYAKIHKKGLPILKEVLS